jgi:hypothetical protein
VHSITTESPHQCIQFPTTVHSVYPSSYCCCLLHYTTPLRLASLKSSPHRTSAPYRSTHLYMPVCCISSLHLIAAHWHGHCITSRSLRYISLQHRCIPSLHRCHHSASASALHLITAYRHRAPPLHLTSACHIAPLHLLHHCTSSLRHSLCLSAASHHHA